MTSLPVIPGHGGFVQPSSYLRPRGQSQPMTSPLPESAIDRDQRVGLVSCPHTQANAWLTLHLQQRIRDFLKVRTSYDVLPLSFRLIIFDTSLLVKKSLTILTQNGGCSVQYAGSRTLADALQKASSQRPCGIRRRRPLEACLLPRTTST